MNVIEQKKFLVKYKLLPFKMRLLVKLNNFIYKILNKSYHIKITHDLTLTERRYIRKNSCQNIFKIPVIKNDAGRATLSYFIPKYINIIIKHSFSLPFNDFKKSFFDNLCIYYELFINNFKLFF